MDIEGREGGRVVVGMGRMVGKEWGHCAYATRGGKRELLHRLLCRGNCERCVEGVDSARAPP